MQHKTYTVHLTSSYGNVNEKAEYTGTLPKAIIQLRAMAACRFPDLAPDECLTGAIYNGTSFCWTETYPNHKEINLP